MRKSILACVLILFGFSYDSIGQGDFNLDLTSMPQCGLEEVSMVIGDKIFTDELCKEGTCRLNQKDFSELEVYKVYRSNDQLEKTNSVLFMISISNPDTQSQWMYTPHAVQSVDLKVLAKQVSINDVITILTTDGKLRFPNNRLRLNIGC